MIIDGFGFDRIEREQSPQGLSLLYKVIDRRGSLRSTALITNIDFDAWNEYLDDGPLVMALLDRLFEKANIKRSQTPSPIALTKHALLPLPTVGKSLPRDAIAKRDGT